MLYAIRMKYLLTLLPVKKKFGVDCFIKKLLMVVKCIYLIIFYNIKKQYCKILLSV